MSIGHLLRYFWGAALGIAPLVLVTACAFDFYDISKSTTSDAFLSVLPASILPSLSSCAVVSVCL